MTYPPPALSPTDTSTLASAAADWSLAHGLAVRPPPALVDSAPSLANLAAVPVPVTLFPSPFPRKAFEQALGVQGAYNALYAAVSQDEPFLEQIVRDVGDSDEFTARLWKTHLRVKEEGYVQNLSLGLFRSDYMVHQDGQIKQVEFNTIAASFGGLSSQTSRLHRYLAKTQYPHLQTPIPALDIPQSEATPKLAAGIRAAYEAYGPGTLHPKCVVFLTQAGERNIFDQRHLEHHVQEDGDEAISVFRVPFDKVLEQTFVADTPKRQLLYRPLGKEVFEVAVVYLRCGYDPGDYPDDTAWEARYHVERSHAIKCPTIKTQLAGAKKVQQVLATPSDTPPLSKFISDPATRHQLSSTFTSIFPLDESPAGLAARALALDPTACLQYVLKPQREGGGNNTYRAAIPAKLRSIPPAHWGAHILMELITPLPVHNVILRHGEIESGGVVCELGVYGTCLWDGEEVLRSEEAGYLLRTKGDQSEEGGVAAGFGCMDSVALV